MCVKGVGAVERPREIIVTIIIVTNISGIVINLSPFDDNHP